MKKVVLALCILAISATGFAQKGNNQIGVGADLGLPIGDFGDGVKLGIGGYVKGLYGIGEAGQITLTAGYQSFKAKSSDDDEDATGHATIIPVLVGYRHNFSGFYAEPQIGYGSYGFKTKIEGQSFSASSGAFTWAVGFGYAMNGLDAGVRYQSGSKDGGTTSIVGIHVGYNFSLGGK